MMLGLDPNKTNRSEIMQTLRARINNRQEYLPPKIVSTGPVKENIMMGDDVDLTMFPVPFWHERDGGRYIGTMHTVISQDPDTGWVNTGTYWMMIHNDSKNETGIMIDPANQHIGGHFLKYMERNEPMPLAVVIGQEPAMTFLGVTPTADEVSEYDIAGAIRGEPIEVVKCETNDIYVPANAEIVLEGTVDPTEKKMEGPMGEYPGYYGGVPGLKVHHL